jgi:hypothetical protein
MQEDSNKNSTPHFSEIQDFEKIIFGVADKKEKSAGFILLSKVAKEKKYAQEYLGLLARRGDIGSIRIGKRWYTTWAWFEEFLENGLKKKAESVSEVQEVKLEEAEQKVVSENVAVSEMKINFSPVIEKEEVKINIPFLFPERENILVAEPSVEARQNEKIVEAAAAVEISSSPADKLADKPEKIAVAVKARKFETNNQGNIAVGLGDIQGIRETRDRRPENIQHHIQPKTAHSGKAPVRNFAPGKITQPLFQKESGLRNISVEEKNRYAVPYQEIKLKKKEDVFSPNLVSREKMAASVFSQFSFAMSFALILLLVAASGYFVWSGGLLARGQVAGASDERNAGFSGITSGGEYVLVSAGDKMKQSLSISRAVAEAAKERGTKK